MKINKEFISRQHRLNQFFKFLGILATWFIAIVFIALVVFVVVKSIPGFQAYTFKGIFLSDKYNTVDLNDPNVSVWLPLCVTLIIGVGSLLIATPLSLKTATFIYFRVKNPSLKKFLKIIIEINAGIPSVIFGLFAYRSLGMVVKNVFGLELANTVLTAIFMISIMLIPTITLLALNAYEGVDNTFITNSMSLGNSKTKAIYKVFRVQTRKQIIVAIIIAAGRVIGETMAVSMVLSSENYGIVFEGGFISILTSSLRPLGAVISKGMFAENAGPAFRGLLFAFGLIMFFVVFVLNSFVIIVTNNKKHKNQSAQWINFTNRLGGWILYLPRQIQILWYKLIFHKYDTVNLDNFSTQTPIFLKQVASDSKWAHTYDYYKKGWEIIDITIVFFMIAWIILDVLLKGLYAAGLPTSTIFSYSKDTTGQAFINTLLLILVTIVISLPISLFIAIGLNEYSKDGTFKKTILFFIDCIGATPSIIFGMFGLIFFIEILQISSGGAMGNSLLAGALTMIIVILPTFTRMNQQALQSVPMQIRENGYSLGNSKWYVIRTLVLPHAYKGILSSTILTIGRILAETAPLYITAGLSSSSVIALMNPSQTLTTRIYAQLSGTSSFESMNVMYESALIVLVLVIIMILISYLIIPNWKDYKKSISNWFYINKVLFLQRNHQVNLEMYKTQISGKFLYLTHEQAKKIHVDENYLWRYNDQFLRTKIVSDSVIQKMETKYLRLVNKLK